MITLFNLKSFPGSKKNRKCRGRGNASGHGTYSGRGQKGQRARSGGKKSLKLKGLKSFLQQIPQRGGFKSLKRRPVIINIKDLEKKFKEGEIITPVTLFKRGLISKIKGQIPAVKILGIGEPTKKLEIKGCLVSKKIKEIYLKQK